MTPGGNPAIPARGHATGVTPGQPECLPAGPRGIGMARTRIFAPDPERSTAGDLDGDTFPALVIPSQASAGIDLIWGHPATGFLFAELDCCDVDSTHSVATGDFNRDERKDLAITEAPYGTVKVKLAQANPPRTFGPAATYTVGLNAS